MLWNVKVGRLKRLRSDNKCFDRYFKSVAALKIVLKVDGEIMTFSVSLRVLYFFLLRSDSGQPKACKMQDARCKFLPRRDRCRENELLVDLRTSAQTY